MFIFFFFSSRRRHTRLTCDWSSDVSLPIWTRELHDALKRRCLYHWIDHPDLEREVAIVLTRAPHVREALARDVAAAVERLRTMDLAKTPGVAETIDWANALAFLGAERLDPAIAADTLGAVVKDHEDQQMVTPVLAEVVADGDG